MIFVERHESSASISTLEKHVFCVERSHLCRDGFKLWIASSRVITTGPGNREDLPANFVDADICPSTALA